MQTWRNVTKLLIIMQQEPQRTQSKEVDSKKIVNHCITNTYRILPGEPAKVSIFDCFWQQIRSIRATQIVSIESW